jgi:hypothetical protein
MSSTDCRSRLGRSAWRNTRRMGHTYDAFGLNWLRKFEPLGISSLKIYVPQPDKSKRIVDTAGRVSFVGATLSHRQWFCRKGIAVRGHDPTALAQSHQIRNSVTSSSFSTPLTTVFLTLFGSPGNQSLKSYARKVGHLV